MGKAAEMLGAVKKKVSTAAEALVVPIYDAIEQKARDRNRPATPREEAWDRWMDLRRSGAPEADQDAAMEKFNELARQR